MSSNEVSGNTNTLKSTFPLPNPQEEDKKILPAEDEDQMETKSKQNYYKDSTLMLHESCYWF